MDENRKTLADRLAELKRNEYPTTPHDSGENILDFTGHHLFFEGNDFNLSMVSARDFTEHNEFGELIAALIETQSESLMPTYFRMHPGRFNGFLLTDRANDACPVGHIYAVKHDVLGSDKYAIQPIYVAVHPNYRRKGLSKVLRLVLLSVSPKSNSFKTIRPMFDCLPLRKCCGWPTKRLLNFGFRAFCRSFFWD